VRRIPAVRTGKIVARAIQVLFVAPPAIAGVVSLASLEISDGTIYLVEALLLFLVVETVLRLLNRGNEKHIAVRRENEESEILEQMDRDDQDERTSWSLYESGYRH
jgi:hypothetical protein